MKKVQITVIDPIICRVPSKDRDVIKHCLGYKKENWSRGEYHMESNLKTQHLITGRTGSSGSFLTGLLPRVKKYCELLGIEPEITFKHFERFLAQIQIPNLNGIKLRRDQRRAIRISKYKYRGIIKAPTGSGKTIIMSGICSLYPKSKIIILCHLKDAVIQTGKKVTSYLPNRYVKVALGKKEVAESITGLNKTDSGILITTIQSLSKIPMKLYSEVFDIILIDEAHRVNSDTSQYGKLLTNNLAPRRYGFTAKLPTKEIELLYNEGLLGPVISELKFKDAQVKGIVAMPQIKLESIPYDMKLNQKCKTYFDFYKHCICENKFRNAIIAKIVKQSISNKIPTLIIIEKIDHGKFIKKKIKNLVKKNVPFVSGISTTEKRDKLKNDLINRKKFVVIVSRIWLEAINIPNLEMIIYAAGMKEKKRAIQAMGRGTRVTEDKTTIKLVDFLDPYKYLAQHSVSRIQAYVEEGWL